MNNENTEDKRTEAIIDDYKFFLKNLSIKYEIPENEIEDIIKTSIEFEIDEDYIKEKVKEFVIEYFNNEKNENIIN